MKDFLSNLFPVNIVFEGVNYPSVENAYQASRTIDVHIRLHRFANTDPAEAKAFGEEHLQIRPDWTYIKQYNTLYDLMLQKFSVHKELGEKLVALSNADICECCDSIITMFLLKIRNVLKSTELLEEMN